MKITRRQNIWPLVGVQKSEFLGGHSQGSGSFQITYLEFILHQLGKYKKEVESSVSQARIAIKELNGVLWSGDIRQEPKKIILKLIVERIFTYEGEAWAFTTKLRNHIKAVEMDGLRRSLRLSRFEKVRDTELAREGWKAYGKRWFPVHSPLALIDVQYLWPVRNHIRQTLNINPLPYQVNDAGVEGRAAEEAGTAEFVKSEPANHLLNFGASVLFHPVYEKMSIYESTLDYYKAKYKLSEIQVFGLMLEH
ncbi:hypothetical protein ANN_13087 [Periplaneta americana]|uniref:Uncharacterized protein n=1 Tax=Periplaneta americana TaxID=6978 RepID=A0ABQ8TJT0_PERAM|nr:hypothetical protein ANN_13087 [Periplaneta americana]